jgi:L,D-transpeptidase ErfK/SrfK
VTHGCVRLFPEDIEWLYSRTGVDMPVRIVNQPIKFGWQGDDLYLEVHPNLESLVVEGEAAAPVVVSMTQVTQEYIQVAEAGAAEVDWVLVKATFNAKTGMPVRVGRRVAAADLAAL